MNSKDGVQETPYYDKLNIPIMNITSIKEMIKDNIKRTLIQWEKGHDVDKQAFHIIGPAGVGKTQITFQIKDELISETGKDFKIIKINAPVLSRDDFLIPFPVKGSRRFEALYSDFVPREEDEFGIFVIDEFSRGDHSLQQLLWQVQNECMLHLYKFPKGWFIISIDNPDDSNYQMDTMEDAAGLRRHLHIYTEVDVSCFLNHAKASNFHPLVIKFIEAYPDYLYDFQGQRKGSVFANPASFEKLSMHLFRYDENISKNIDIINNLASGLLNCSMAQIFTDFIVSETVIRPDDIIFDYRNKRIEVLKLIGENKNEKIAEILIGVFTTLKSRKLVLKREEKINIASFLSDIDIDTATIFLTETNALKKNTEEYRYFIKLIIEMTELNQRFKKEYFENLVNASSKKNSV